jgi:hypothetical protein
MVVGTLFTLFVTPAVYTFLAKDHQKLKSQAAAHASLGEIDAAAGAGILFPGEPEPEQSEGHSAEVLAFTSAATVAKSEQPGQGKKGGRRPPKRRPLTPAAE